MAIPQLSSQAVRSGGEDLRGLALSYIQAIWRRRWIAMAVTTVVCAIGWVGVAMLPNQYESTARIYVNADTLLQPLLQGLAIDTDPGREVDYLQRTLLSRPNLQELMHLADLDAGAKTPAETEARLRDLASDINITQPSPSLFAIAYDNVSPITAKNVVQGMITIFSEAAAGTNRAEMDNAQTFLTTQIAKYEAQLKAADERRAAFREKYADLLPDAANGATRLEAARTALRQSQFALNDAVAKRDALKGELASTPQLLNVEQAPSVIVTNGTAMSTGTAAELDMAQHRLSLLLTQDTEQHPDVIAARKQIAALKVELEAEKKGDRDHGGAAGPRHASISNPVYEQLKLRLADQESTVASLTQQLQAAQDQEKQTEDLVRQAPGIELQAQNLDRDYSVLKKNYEELVSRRESTQIGEAADTQADRIQFRVVDPPQVPLKPSSPHRPLLFSGVLAAALASGVGVAFLLAQLDRSFATLIKLKALAVPILGSVSLVDRFDAKQRHMKQLGVLSASMLVLLTVYSALVLFSFRASGGVF